MEARGETAGPDFELSVGVATPDDPWAQQALPVLGNWLDLFVALDDATSTGQWGPCPLAPCNGSTGPAPNCDTCDLEGFTGTATWELNFGGLMSCIGRASLGGAVLGTWGLICKSRQFVHCHAWHC